MIVWGFWGMVGIWAAIVIGGGALIGLAIRERRKWLRRLFQKLYRT
jgi:hypothetical protein